MNMVTHAPSSGWAKTVSAAAIILALSPPNDSFAQAAAASTPPRMFETSDTCIACHNGVTTSFGEDVSIGADWRASMMANSARDPYWQATIRREVLDHPGAQAEIEAECSTCHMPMARYTAHVGGGVGQVFSHLPAVRGGARASPPTERDLLAADGVSCTVCHQIQPDGLGSPESFVGGFIIDSTTAAGERNIFGPFTVDEGRSQLMHSATQLRPTEASHIQQSELCATCHTLYTHARNEQDETVGELPEQVPFLEWQHSDYRTERSCQSCHMPVVTEPVPVTGVLAQPRDSVSRHVFRGGNFFILRMLNRHRAELGVQALSQELDAAAVRTVTHLQSSTARIRIEDAQLVDGRLEATVVVTNLAGHKLPTAYPSRRVWIHLTATDAQDRVVFESGAFQRDGSIAGNDNDENPEVYEPHYTRIESEAQVQIFETIMLDYRNNVTTGVTTGIRYAKDNRILPRGFDKAAADEDIAVYGRAVDDDDFVEPGDRVSYSLSVSGTDGPYTVQVELWYQPIAYRWARNLGTQDAMEITRFLSWYDEMAAASAIVLATDSATVQ